MSYESLSTVVVLVIVVIVMAGWLPVRTAKGMRKVAEHREDKFSPSLHLIGMDDGTRFSDEHTPQAKGIIMQPDRTRDAKYTPARVAHVRQLRRAAIRRRRILVVSLLAVTVLVLALAFALKFSPLFALIPAALTAVVLALGARAAAQAREWERKVAAARKSGKVVRRPAAQRPAGQVAADGKTATGGVQRAAAQSGQTGAVQSDRTVEDRRDDPATDVMEQREIRRVLHQAQIEQAQALAERDAARTAAAASQTAHVADTTSATTDGTADASAASADQTVHTDADQAAASDDRAAVPVVMTVVDAAPIADQPDETSELAHVKPSRAMEAFDAVSQDLISFSLGAPRNGVEPQSAVPESLEIKSMRQVAKAVPVAEPEAAEPTPDVAESGESDKSATVEAVADHTDSVNDTAAFHAAEEHVDIDAPDATADSLGTGLEAILARRSA
ncbi:hypothetical protein DSM100688_2166 [Bifidobacterium ramosum]|uniref:Membrane associated protein n=1 Tax=Bifidobacterium ramosum TaxID=1798158 RepID=A0A6L4WXI7_9BIFI|nr:hypothetical protein [Bifidobacterium ramosum]KAB8286729.1 hypothetical protein DSM100688_2166 [Bifidobacterium ramosum]NEG71740.1 hypothetical protein [Bifidobacterium ramosum]